MVQPGLTGEPFVQLRARFPGNLAPLSSDQAGRGYRVFQQGDRDRPRGWGLLPVSKLRNFC